MPTDTPPRETLLFRLPKPLKQSVRSIVKDKGTTQQAWLSAVVEKAATAEILKIEKAQSRAKAKAKTAKPATKAAKTTTRRKSA